MTEQVIMKFAEISEATVDIVKDAVELNGNLVFKHRLLVFFHDRTVLHVDFKGSLKERSPEILRRT